MKLKESEHFMSSQFLQMILKELFNITKDNSLSLSAIYDLIPIERRVESISPLPEVFEYELSNDVYISNNFIPILLSSIPEQLP